MPLYKGNTKIGAIYKGTTPISAIYKGSTLIFSSYTWQEWYVEYVYNTLVPTTINSKNVLDKAKVSTIYGNSVVENQLVDLSLQRLKQLNTSGTWNDNVYTNKGITFIVNSNNIVVNGTATGGNVAFIISRDNDYQTNPKSGIYLIKGCPSGGSNSTYCMKHSTSFDNIDTGNGSIATYPYDFFLFYIFENQTLTNKIVEPLVSYITQMFPFNTPTTLTDTRVQAILNRGYIPYNTGTLKNVDMSEVSSTNADTTPLQTLSLKYQGGGVNTAHDTTVIDNDNVVFTKKMSSVDLGSLTFTYEQLSNSRSAFFVKINDLAPTTSDNEKIIALSSMYNATTYNATWVDKDMAYRYSSGGASGNKNIIVFINNSYTDPTTFKTAMSGVMLEYPLTTPQVITIPRKHIGVVDLGSLNWTYNYGSFYTSQAVSNINNGVQSQVSNIYCAKYKTNASYYLGNATWRNIDKAIMVQTNGKQICINDSSFDNATDFKNSLSGQYLYYETTDESTITNIIGIQSGGTITTNSEVLPNIDFELKAK